MVVVHAGNSKSLSESVRELLLKCTCAVLINKV